MTPALQAFVDELAALQEKVRLQEAEIAVLKSMRGLDSRVIDNTIVPSEVQVFGRSIGQLGRDLDRLKAYDRAAGMK
jgi:SMC interacting uncharacterized protein involved in chromosome segregation